jgi:hypothetical protein
LKRLLHGGVFIFVGVNKKHEKFSAKTTKNYLTFAVRPVILLERACEGTAYYAMKREIARGNEVTSVEYVRYRLFPVRNRAAETSPVHAYIARAECEPAKSRFVFRTRPDTHGCVYRIYGGFIRKHKDGPNAVTQTYDKGEQNPWQQQRT